MTNPQIGDVVKVSRAYSSFARAAEGKFGIIAGIEDNGHMCCVRIAEWQAMPPLDCPTEHLTLLYRPGRDAALQGPNPLAR